MLINALTHVCMNVSLLLGVTNVMIHSSIVNKNVKRWAAVHPSQWLVASALQPKLKEISISKKHIKTKSYSTSPEHTVLIHLKMKRYPGVYIITHIFLVVNYPLLQEIVTNKRNDGGCIHPPPPPGSQGCVDSWLHIAQPQDGRWWGAEPQVSYWGITELLNYRQGV